MSDLELKKYCIEQAMKLGGDDVVKTAREFHAFLSGPAVETPSAQPLSPPRAREVVTRPWVAPRLTATQKAVLSVIVQMHIKGERINGRALGAEMKSTGSNGYAHLKNLTRLGYVRRISRAKYIALYRPDGSEVGIIKTVLPAMPAKGYKPLTAKLGDIGRAVC